MPSIIQVLDDKTINQIAAGEVIENPASVIKELIENSLDAESTHICIEVIGSGRHLIRISDNGIGMSKDDAVLCFERHATSKVRSIEDLNDLFSMGFRGEALASIASVAKVRLLTRPRDAAKGTLVEIHGGKILETADVPCDYGTSLEISDLFYNVPARKKFLKSIKQDLLEIQKMATQIAFAHPLVHFQLLSEGEILLEASATTHYLERAKQLLHEAVFESMIPFEMQEGDIHLEGLIGDPTLHRPNKTGQAIFINQRPVSSWEIAQSVTEGYGTSLPERRYPVFHLHVKLPPSEFDINVHPQKKEVRFSHFSILKEAIKKGISTSLNRKMHIQAATSPSIETTPLSWTPQYFAKKHEPEAKTNPAPFFERENSISLPLPTSHHIPAILASLPYYLLLEAENGFEVLDIQRARKRIIYENVLASFHKRPLEKQLLLAPLTQNFSEDDTALLIQHLEAFETAGFEIRPFGKMTFLIESLPAFIKEAETESILQEILKSLASNKNSLQEHLSDRFAKAAIQHIAQDSFALPLSEAKSLLSALFACQQTKFTPSGQNIFAKISYDDLKGWFK